MTRRRRVAPVGDGNRVRLALALVAVALAAALAFGAALGGCRPGEDSSAGNGGTEWAEIASAEGWPSIPDDEFDSYLDSLADENVRLANEAPTAYVEPLAIVVGTTPEDPASRGAEPHILAFDGTQEGSVSALRDLGGMIARSGQRPLAVFLIAEASGSGQTVLPGPSAAATISAAPSQDGLVLLTIGLTIDGRINKAVQVVDLRADGTYAIGEPSEVVHVADAADLRSDHLTAFYEGYVEGRGQ